MDFLEPLLIWIASCFPFFIPLIIPVGSYGFYKHAARHTDGSDDIRNATNTLKGLMTASQVTDLEEIDDITPTQWGYLGGLDQPLATSNTPTFAGLIMGESNRIIGGTKELADNAAYSFTPTVDHGAMMIWCKSQSLSRHLILSFDISSDAIFAWVNPADTAVVTGVLTGTTGADGSLTVSVHSVDGKIYIENRIGATRIIDWVMFGV